MEKVKLGGMKQSLELCQFDLRGPESPERIVPRASKLLASQKINIAFLTYNQLNHEFHQLTICPHQCDFTRSSEIINTKGTLPRGWTIQSREHVGILTIYPHHSPIQIIGCVMVLWAAQSIPIYGIATSLSAISFITDYHVIDKGIVAIQNSFQLPDDHAPIKPELIYYQSDEVKRGKGN
jgi:aspartokinase